MKQLIILLFIARFVSVGFCQAQYPPFLEVPQSFVDTMNFKVKPTGDVFYAFVDVSNGVWVVDSTTQYAFSTEFASLIATGWTASYHYDGCYDVPSCFPFEKIMANQKMFYLKSALIASRTIKIITHDTTYTQTLAANSSFTLKLPVIYSGTTNGSGDYTVTFAHAYSVAPSIDAHIVGGTDMQGVTATVSTTGFTVHAYFRSTLTVLGINLVSSAISDLTGANVDVTITEK